MRKVGVFSDEQPAKLLGAWLLTQGIANDIDVARDGWAIWVHEDAQLAEATVHLEDFVRDPDNPKYIASTRSAERIRKSDFKEALRREQNLHDMRTRGPSVGRGTLRITKTLIVISVLVTVLTGAGDNLESSILRAFRYYGVEIMNGQIWRIFTPMFLHFGIMHIVFNMMWLWQLGGLLEPRYGSRYFLILIFVSAALSNIAQDISYVIDGSASPAFNQFVALIGGMPFGGMSGVVYALLGFVWMRGKKVPAVRISSGTVKFMIFWLFLCMTELVGNIANTAHVVGLLVGMVFGVLGRK